METETPVLHLGLSDDERLNRNWAILDDVMHRLAKGTQIADDLSILGSLDVRDDLTVGGDATVMGMLQANIVQGLSEVVAPRLTAGAFGLQVLGGTVDLPGESIDGPELAPNATVTGVWIGTANTTPIQLIGTDLELASVTPDATELQGRWELVIAQATLRAFSTTSPPLAESVTMTLSLKRGGASGTIQQTRTLHAAFSTPGTVDLPVTIVRLGIPPQLDTRMWSLLGHRQTTPTATSASSLFGQLHVIQFR